MAAITLRGVEKRYAAAKKGAADVVVVKNVDLEIKDGEFVVLVGPSGCGKSTTLRMIAGLETISGGELLIDGVKSNDVAPGDRDLAMVFQSYALYPHMSVRENIAFGLRVRGVSSSEIDVRTNDAAAMLGLSPLLDRKPKALSGGQRQRVAMARAIVRRPKAFLFDEPLSNLDAKLRMEVRADIASLQRRFATTMVYVTHDQVEAMTLADRIVVLNEGIVQQVGAPLELFRKPANRFVATFLGTPTMNVIERNGAVAGSNLRGETTGAVAGSNGRGEARDAVAGSRGRDDATGAVAGSNLRGEASGAAPGSGLRAHLGGGASSSSSSPALWVGLPEKARALGARPHDVRAVSPSTACADGCLRLGEIEVDLVERLGQESFAFGRLDGARVGALVDDVKAGARVALDVARAKLTLFDAAGARIDA